MAVVAVLLVGTGGGGVGGGGGQKHKVLPTRAGWLTTKRPLGHIWQRPNITGMHVSLSLQAEQTCLPDWVSRRQLHVRGPRVRRTSTTSRRSGKVWVWLLLLLSAWVPASSE